MSWLRENWLRHLVAATTMISIGALIFYFRMPSSNFVNPHFEDGNHTFRAGETICLKYTVQRLDTCTLEIARYIEDVKEKKETLIQFQTQLITPGPPRPSGFTPCPVVPPGTEPGRYKLFPRVRYYCNPLDYAWPRIVNFPSVDVDIVP